MSTNNPPTPAPTDLPDKDAQLACKRTSFSLPLWMFNVLERARAAAGKDGTPLSRSEYLRRLILREHTVTNTYPPHLYQCGLGLAKYPEPNLEGAER